jgi:hypothetical protein
VDDCLLQCLRCLHKIYTKVIILICQLYNYRYVSAQGKIFRVNGLTVSCLD